MVKIRAEDINLELELYSFPITKAITASGIENNITITFLLRPSTLNTNMQSKSAAKGRSISLAKLIYDKCSIKIIIVKVILTGIKKAITMLALAIARLP